jgi:hypothetical protein
MKPTNARLILTVIAAMGIVVGLLGLGSSGQFDSNLSLGLFVIGGVAGVMRLAISARG